MFRGHTIRNLHARLHARARYGELEHHLRREAPLTFDAPPVPEIRDVPCKAQSRYSLGTSRLMKGSELPQPCPRNRRRTGQIHQNSGTYGCIYKLVTSNFPLHLQSAEP